MIEYNKLYNLYITKEKSMSECGKHFNCTASNVKYYLDKYKIPTRKNKICNISFEDLYNYYIIENHSILECSKKFNCSKDTILSRLIKYKIKKDQDKINLSREKTCLKKYNSTNVSKQFVSKIRETFNKKYKVNNISQKHIKHYDIWINNDKFLQWIKNEFEIKNRKINRSEILNFFNVQNIPKRIKNISLFYKYFNPFNSYFEQLVADYLIDHNIKFKHNDRTIIKPYELDFIIPSKKIAIEVNDTKTHHPDNLEYWGRPKNYHEIKDKMTIEANYQLIHLNEWEKDFITMEKLKVI